MKIALQMSVTNNLSPRTTVLRCILFFCILFLTQPMSAQDKRYHGDGVDEVLQYVPLASVYTLKALGVKNESSWKRLVINSAVSFTVNAGVTYGTFHPSRRHRQPFLSIGPHLHCLLWSHRAAQGIRKDFTMDQRGRLFGGHAHSHRPCAPQPPPLGRCACRSGHRCALDRSRLPPWRPVEQGEKNGGCGGYAHRLPTHCKSLIINRTLLFFRTIVIVCII